MVEPLTPLVPGTLHIGSGGFTVSSFSFTAAQIRLSNIHQLVAGQPGKILIPVTGVFIYTFVTTPYSVGNCVWGLGVEEGGNFFGPLSQGNVMSATQDVQMILGAFEGAVGSFGETLLTGLPLAWKTAFADPPSETGDGTVAGQITYMVYTV